MSILFKLACLSLAMSFIAEAYRESYVKVMACALFFSTCFLYVFYIFDFFFIGIYLLTGIFVIVAIMSILKLVKERREILSVIKGIISPQWMITIMVFCINWWFTRTNIVKLIDELHLWAALPKALYYTRHFQSGIDSLLVGYKDYIPGMPVTLCFFEWLNGAYEDHVLYFGYCCYGSIAMLIATSHLKWRNWLAIIPIGVGISIAPLMFYNTIFNDSTIWFKSIHVDPVLGILVGCGLFLIYDAFWESSIGTATFTLLLCVIVLMKSSGIALAILMASSVLLLSRISKIEIGRMKQVLVVAAPVLIWASWKFVRVFFAVSTSAEFRIENIFVFEYLKVFLKAVFTDAVVYFNNVNTGIPAGFIGSVVLLLFLCTAVYLLQEKQNKKRFWFVVMLWGGLAVFFLFGLFIIYCGTMKAGYAGTPSYPRYICTMLTALWIGIVLISIKSFQLHRIKVLKKMEIGYLFISLVLCICLFPHTPPIGITYPNKVYPEADRYAQEIRQDVPEGNVLLIVDDHYNELSADLYFYLQRRMYYDLLDCDIQMCSISFLESSVSMDSGSITVPEDERVKNITYIALVQCENDVNNLELIRVERADQDSYTFNIN